jgi:hypothetical protein
MCFIKINLAHKFPQGKRKLEFPQLEIYLPPHEYDALLIQTVKLIEIEITQTKGNIGGNQEQAPPPTLSGDTATKSAPSEKSKP